MAIFKDLKLSLGEDLKAKLTELDPNMGSFRILKKSLDARKKSQILHIYSVETFTEATPPALEAFHIKKLSSPTEAKTIVIGAGPAGLFCALRLLARGIPCEILERGKALNPRMRDISAHWRKGQIDPDSNVSFGEGGAGCFSDGKLITRIKSEHKEYVMREFVRFGAPEEILHLANPHVGSNKIRGIISQLISYLEEKGCPVRFNSRVDDFIIQDKKLNGIMLSNGKRVDAQHVVLATGHSAHDIYEKFFELGIECEPKAMAMGFRIEHSQKWLNMTQYGSQWEHPELPVANYKLSQHDPKTDTGVYSFCMCPGGYVLPSSPQKGHMVVNGMSNYNHGSPYANSGLVVSIDPKKWYPRGARQALDFQRSIERKAQQLVIKEGGSREVPAQRVVDFLASKKGEIGKSSCPSGVIAVNLRKIFPEPINKAMIEALHSFERKMPGFLSSEALLHGVESRTSSPIRITRDKDTFNSLSCSNLYPAGEGAGYAGGITSAAVDGIKIAEAIYKKHS